MRKIFIFDTKFLKTKKKNDSFNDHEMTIATGRRRLDRRNNFYGKLQRYVNLFRNDKSKALSSFCSDVATYVIKKSTDGPCYNGETKK